MKRYEHGLVMGKFYPLHAGHSALIRAASRQCRRVSVQDHGDGGTQPVHYTHRSPQSLTGVRVSLIGFGS